MAYTTIRTAATGDPPWTASEYNVFRANFELGVPALTDAKGTMAIATGENAAAALTVGANLTYLVAASGESTGVKYAHNSAARVSNYSATLGNGIMSFGTEDSDVFGVYGGSGLFAVTVAGYYFISISFTASTAGSVAVNDSLKIALKLVPASTNLANLCEVYAQAATATAIGGSGSAIVALSTGVSYGFYGTVAGTWAASGLAFGGAQVRASIIRLGSIGVA